VRPPVKAGIGLALAVTLWNLAIILAGLQTNMLASFAFIVVSIVLNAGALLWSLTQTVDTQTFGLQIRDAAILGVVAAVLIFVTSWLTLDVLFPEAFAETIDVVVNYIEGLDLSAEDKAQGIARIESRTAFRQSLMGMWGTLLTSVVLGAVIAIFRRKK